MAASEGVDLEFAIVDHIRMTNGTLISPNRKYSTKIQQRVA